MRSGPWCTRLLVHFVSGGRDDQYQIAEWVHEAYRYGQRSQRSHPSLGSSPRWNACCKHRTRS